MIHSFSPVALEITSESSPTRTCCRAEIHKSAVLQTSDGAHSQAQGKKHACHLNGVKSGTLFFNFSVFSYLKSQIIDDDFKRYFEKLNHMYISSAK